MESEAVERGLSPAIVVMGVSASGKTSAGQALARRLGCDFVDGDDLHPPANVAKMSAGTPLTDEDRWPWLDRVGAILGDARAHPRGVVIACSALRKIYRDRIRAAAGRGVGFVFLDITRAEAARRIAGRRGHFMPASLLDSQFATLERPVGEPGVAPVSAQQSVEAIAAEAAQAIRTAARRPA